MKFKYFLLACCLLLAAVLCGCATAPAVEPDTDVLADALSAYQEILKAAPAVEDEHGVLGDASLSYEQSLEMFGKHYDMFAITDINQDGIPELIALTTINSRWAPISVYSYADGSAVLLKDPLDEGAHGTFEQQSTANGAYITYICEENHIHSVWRGTDPAGNAAEENHAYALEGTILVAADCTVGESESTVYFSDIAMANTAENVDAITR